MTDAELLADYRAMCLQTVTIRRYAGAVPNRTATDYTAAGNARLYGAKEVVGSVKQGDHRVVVIAEDLTAGGFTLPLTADDKFVQDGGRETAILAPMERKGLSGTIIAYELTTRG